MKGLLMEKIRVFVGLLGMDQHEVGAVAVSRMLRDAGMEVVYGGRFNTPPGIVKTSLEEDVDVIGLSCHSWEYLHYMPALLGLLKEKGLDIPVVVGGSVITPGDGAVLSSQGVAAVFGPSSTPEDIIETLKKISRRKTRG
jgi:methylmalonyl-CoA mutase C-terminal domain/subunit